MTLMGHRRLVTSIIRLVVFVANRLAFLHACFEFSSVALQCNISTYFSGEQSTTTIDVTSCYVAFDVRPEERMHGTNCNLDLTRDAGAIVGHRGRGQKFGEGHLR